MPASPQTTGKERRATTITSLSTWMSFCYTKSMPWRLSTCHIYNMQALNFVCVCVRVCARVRTATTNQMVSSARPVTRVANLALSNTFVLLFVAERNGARATRLSLSAMLLECQQTMIKSLLRAHRSRDYVMHLINVRQSKLRLAPPLWFCTINTIRNVS